MLRGLRVFLPVCLLVTSVPSARAQIDPEKRRLIQLGYNQPLEGRGPFAGYGFFYYNEPHFFATNLTLRVAMAPVYLDSELGFSGLLGPRTDLALGLAGGGFADGYSEIRDGVYRRRESFIGHGGEFSASLYHRLEPEIPFWVILRGSVHQSFFEQDSRTDSRFKLPEDRTSVNVRTGLRFGGQEPSLTAPLAMELSVWHESQFRPEAHTYGFGGDRKVEPDSHLFWARGLVKYTFGKTEHSVDLSATGGGSVNADRFSAYRLGGFLPFVSEFPLSIPGYYFQEISAQKFLLFQGEYSFPLEPAKNWRFTTFASTGPVEYLKGLDQSRNWHTGVGAGITYISPSGSWFATVVYGHGFDAIRSEGRGANHVGILFQYDFEAKPRGKHRWFIPSLDPYRGGERIFR